VSVRGCVGVRVRACVRASVCACVHFFLCVCLVPLEHAYLLTVYGFSMSVKMCERMLLLERIYEH
jgi:hypothetical protein